MSKPKTHWQLVDGHECKCTQMRAKVPVVVYGFVSSNEITCLNCKKRLVQFKQDLFNGDFTD